jgi:hypothetical protein
MKIDIHIHTRYSPDSLITPVELMEQCKSKGIEYVGITDHNTIEGALKLKEEVSIRVIVGEEIKTEHGEIIGLFLKNVVPSGLSVVRTIELIKEQGGIIYLPHPFDGLRRSMMDIVLLEKIVDKIDVMEVFNSRSLFMLANDIAFKFAKEHNIIPAVGSDAHTKYEIGNSYIEMDDFNSGDEFLKKLKNAQLFARRTPFSTRVRGKAARILRCID